MCEIDWFYYYNSCNRELRILKLFFIYCEANRILLIFFLSFLFNLTRFRTCLKMADSSDATMVGKLFFNIVQTKCFVLKPERICKKRSWWGKCEKKVVRKRAHLRDNRKF